MSASHHIIDVPIPPKDSPLKEIAVAALFRIGGGRRASDGSIDVDSD